MFSSRRSLFVHSALGVLFTVTALAATSLLETACSVTASPDLSISLTSNAKGLYNPMTNTGVHNSSPGPGIVSVIEEQPGRATLTEQDGLFMVIDGDGNTQYTGNEIGAEFAYWCTLFGVPVDDEVHT